MTEKRINVGKLDQILSGASDNRAQVPQIEPLETADAVSQKAARESPKRSKQEQTKESSNFLHGTIAEELAQDSGRFTSDDASLLKFHGIYQQDDRDARKARQLGAGKASKKHIFMVRTKVPGGRMTSGQLLAELDVCDQFADGTLRITTRQGLQLHGVVKGNLWHTVHKINQSMLTTLGACGDVVRNVMCCPAPQRSGTQHDAGHGCRNRQALRTAHVGVL